MQVNDKYVMFGCNGQVANLDELTVDHCNC